MRTIVLWLGLFCVWAHAAVFVYAPGVAPPAFSSYAKTMKDACRALRSLELFPADRELRTTIDTEARIGTVIDAYSQHIVYVPLFLDYDAKTPMHERCIAQNRDLADLIYVCAYAVTTHNAFVHCLGHSRGAGTIAVCMGLMWHDPAYLEALIARHWSVPRSHMVSHASLREAIGAHIGSLCLMGTFDNLSETISNIIDALALPRIVRRYLEDDPRRVYEVINSVISLPQYDWTCPYTPRNVIQYIPAHVPCIFLHAENDAINPVSVARDLYHIRAAIAPDRSHMCLRSNSSFYASARHIGLPVLTHIEYPYLQSVADVGALIMHYVHELDLLD